MARQTPDGILRVHWVPAIDDTAAPTVAELGAGVELTPFIAPAGIVTPDEGTEADASDLGSVRDKSVPSTVGGSIEAEMYRDDETDTAWTALPRGESGYLVVAPFGGSGDDGEIVATDSVEVWTSRVSNRNPNRYARGDVFRFTVSMTVEADPVYNAVVAAT